MPDLLTDTEERVLRIVRSQTRQGDPVTTAVIRNAAWDEAHISYDRIDRALLRLVKLGKITKPSRGHYLPVDDAPLGVAQSERHSEAYDPGPRWRIGGQYFDVDDVPPRGDRDY